MTHPEPDTKDWTWTLDRTCPECGLTASDYGVEEVADRAEAAAVEWMQILTSNPAVLLRPTPKVWSALEYGAHVRDVYQLFDERLVLMLDQDEPTFANWDPDVAAIEGGYAEADPDVVADEITAHAATFVDRLRSLDATQLARRGFRTGGAEFTITTFAQYFLHDVIHHLWDVTGQQGVPALR